MLTAACLHNDALKSSQEGEDCDKRSARKTGHNRPVRACVAFRNAVMFTFRLLFCLSLLICVRGRCPPGSMPGSVGGCYFFRYTPRTRDEAIKDCNARDADLITIRGPDDESVIYKSNDDFKPDNFLIGAFKLASRSVEGVKPNTWTWVDRSPFNYTNWQNGIILQPANLRDMNLVDSYANIEGDAVALLNHNSWTGVWTSVPMNDNDRFPYVCLARHGFDDQRHNCEGGFTGLTANGGFTGLTANDCYFGPAGVDTYENAEAWCEGYDGTLPVIHDQQTNDLVQGIIAGMGYPRFLLGASDNSRDFVWRWADYSAMDYQNWATSGRTESTFLTGDHSSL